ncbi:hypothetical protein [Sphaerisporangium album]|nr:hypothetical protein [Sphaerisporangium album]
MTHRTKTTTASHVTLAALLGATLSVAVSVSAPSAAHAANACHSGAWNALGDGEVKYDEGPTGDLKYPATLHGKTVRLYSNRANASARAEANLSAGDVMGIDRSNFTVTGPNADHNWLRTHEVEARGTWDYCEVTAGSNGTYSTPRIDGAHRAVRVCILHNGGRQCTNVWYADNDDDSGDWS